MNIFIFLLFTKTIERRYSNVVRMHFAKGVSAQGSKQTRPAHIANIPICCRAYIHNTVGGFLGYLVFIEKFKSRMTCCVLV